MISYAQDSFTTRCCLKCVEGFEQAGQLVYVTEAVLYIHGEDCQQCGLPMVDNEIFNVKVAL